MKEVTVTSTSGYASLGDPKLLDKIDKLFACGAQEYVRIPQIVMLGDQSSGKSSVLASLLKRPLPRDSSLCTRFATKIIFRRDKEVRGKAQIIADPRSSEEHREEVRLWGTHEWDTLADDKFLQIMEKAKKVMGIDHVRDGIPQAFSRDVLQLEIHGPDEPQVSVIDVPGIFRKPIDGITTKDDVSFVRDMIVDYMQNERAVILAVIPANGDLALQEVLELASEIDPEGDRTFGVLTKPDLVDKGAEKDIINLLQNHTHKLKLGWHILRNPGKSEMSFSLRDWPAEERKFFSSTKPWDQIASEQCGIVSLASRLGDILSSMLRKDFPKVRSDIQCQLTEREMKLSALGDDRTERLAQASYLTKLAEEFQRVVGFAMLSNHGAHPAFARREELKIASKIIKRMDTFNDDMKSHGAVYSFKQGRKSVESWPGDGYTDKPTKQEKRYSVRSECDAEDIRDILLSSETVVLGSIREGNNAWLERLYNENRGFELAILNPSTLTSAMKTQIEKWSDISLGYISDVIVLIHRFVIALLEEICSDQAVSDAIYELIFEKLRGSYEEAIRQAKMLHLVEVGGPMLTQNAQFMQAVEKSREKRHSELWKEFDHAVRIDHGPKVDIRELSVQRYRDNNGYILQDMHDILSAYYTVTRDRFIDNMCKIATDHYLLQGEGTPLEVFSAHLVSGLDPEQLDRIAGESSHTKALRAQLRQEVEILREAKSVLV